MAAHLQPNLLRDVVDRAIAQGWVFCVMCEESETDEIIGWCAYEQTRLLWMARKPRYKGLKIGSKFLDHMPQGRVDCAFINPKYTMMLNEQTGRSFILKPYIVTEILYG